MFSMISVIIFASLLLVAVFSLRYKAYTEEEAVRKVANNFPEIGIYWNEKVDAQENLKAILKKKEAIRTSIDECQYFPNDEQRINSLKESYHKVYLEEKQCREEVKKAIQQINDYEKAHFGEEKDYFWPIFLKINS